MIPENNDNNPHEPNAGPDDLERLLARQTFRAPPPGWREAILTRAAAAAAAATATAALEAERARATTPPAPGARTRWFACLDRLSSGWSPIAAAWLLVIGLNQYSAHPLVPRGMTYPPLSATSLAELRADRAELRELANLTAPAPTPQGRPSPVHRAPAGTPTRPRAQLPARSQSLACIPHLTPLPV